MADVTPQTPPLSLGESSRLRTPDAPLHGARFDTNGPLSPRRSRRPTRNPYSSTSGARTGAVTTPPQSSPLSPPSSPSRAAQRTPEKRAKNKLHPRWDPRGSLMTPAKTPQQTITPPPSRVRRLHFQVADPSHAMPTPRKMKKSSRVSAHEVYGRGSSTEEVEIYSDWNARVPARDDALDNPFLGPPTPATSLKQRQRKATPQPLGRDMSKDEMQRRVENDEGMIFTFRGKQVFRPYRDTIDNVEEAQKLGYTIIDRSKNRPRRLSFGRRQDRPPPIEADEEALTDIELGDDLHDDITPVGSQTTNAAPSKSPFADWARTKSGSRKRESEASSSTTTAKKARSDL